MPKMRFDQDALKGFFALHVEKIVLGVIVLLLVVLVYSGYSLEGLPTNRAPDDLKQYADGRVKDVINDDSVWPQFAEEHRPPTGYPQRVQGIQVPINSISYRGEVNMTPEPIGPSGLKRPDPDLLPPTSLEVAALVAAVPYVPVSRDEVDPLMDAKDTEPKKKEVKKRPKKSNRRGRGGEGMDPYGMGGYGAEDGDDMEGGYPSSMGEGGYPGMSTGGSEGYGGSMLGMGGIGGMSGVGGAASGSVIIAQNVEGFRPPAGSIGKARNIVSVRALVPLKDQWNEFEAKFSTAMDYNPSRDTPQYVGYLAQRAEVKDETQTDFDWKPISSTGYVVRQMQERKPPYGGWAGFPQEIADPRYVKPNVLTMPTPPVLMKPLETFALHSEVPRARLQMVKPKDEDDKDKKTETEEDADPTEGIGDAPIVGPVGPGGVGGGMYGSGAAGMGMPGMGAPGMGAPGMGAPGMSMPGMGMPGMGSEGYGGGEESYYGSSSYGASPYGGSPYGDEDGDDDMYGGGGYPGGSYGSGMGMGATRTPGPQVDTLMIRFFDFTARPGKKYRYRVQVFLVDPNHPQNPQMDPNDRALAPEVKVRLQELAKKEAESKTREYYRSTDFSDPSPVVEVEVRPETLAGEIVSTRDTKIRTPLPEDLTIPTSERAAKVMSVVWDRARAVDVPTIVDAYRGTFLNFTSDADVIHPINLRYKTLEGYDFETDRLVLDFQGGETLPEANGDSDEPLLAPTELLLMNENGELVVRNEFDDWDAYQRHVVPEIEAPSTTGYPGGYGDEGDEGDYPGYLGGGGYEDGGMGGYGGSRRGGRRGGRRGSGDD